MRHQRLVVAQLGKDHAPADAAADVVVLGRAVAEVEQRRRLAANEREQEMVTERIAHAANGVAEDHHRLARHGAKRLGGELAGERVLGEVKIAHHPALAGGMSSRFQPSDARYAARVELGEPVRRPGDDLAHGADDQRDRGRHQAGIRNEVAGHFDALAPRPHADAGGAPIEPGHDHRHRQQMRQQQRELLDGPIAPALFAWQLE